MANGDALMIFIDINFLVLGFMGGIVRVFFEKDSPANTLSPDFAAKIMKKEQIILGGSYDVDVISLSEILKLHLSRFSGDYFLDIDVEGLDYDVISSFDFVSLQRPIMVVIEDNASKVLESNINQFLESKNYSIVARTPISSLYLDFSRDEIIHAKAISRI